MFSLIDILNISAAWIGAITGVTGLFYSIFINRARLLITDAYAMEVSNEAPYKYSFKLVNPSNNTYTNHSILSLIKQNRFMTAQTTFTLVTMISPSSFIVFSFLAF